MIRFAMLFLILFMGMRVANAVPPNFVVIVADDLGATDCEPFGNSTVRTPHLARLANTGLTFEQAFLTCSSCSPSRSSILTGRYPHLTDAEQLHWPLPQEQQTFVERLQSRGYYTAAAGKWHLGPSAKRGFDVVEEASTQGFQLPADNGGSPATMIDLDNASGCAGWVPTLAKRPQGKPFFLWLAALDPHRDYSPGILAEPHIADQVRVPFFLPNTEKVRKDFAAYYDEVSRLDAYVGAVLDEIDRQGIAEETYVIFLSDNGRPFPRCKTTLFDSGIQTPLIVRCPGKIEPNQRTQALVSSIDLSATLLDLAGVEIPATMQGISFKHVLESPESEHREAVFAEHNWHDYDAYQRAVRTKKFKYVRNFDSHLPLTPPADVVRSDTFIEMRRLRDSDQLLPQHRHCFVAPRYHEELYHLGNDTDECCNVALDPSLQGVLEEHRRMLDQWRIDTEDSARTVRSVDEFDRETGAPLANRQRPRLGKYDGFQPMFNGRDLSGWRLTNSAASTWTIDGELLVCNGKPVGELRTEKMYQNFIMELEWRHMVPGGNAGVFIWADDITAKGVPFHRGIEIQVLENDYGQSQHHTTHGDIFPIHGAAMTPINGRGGNRAFPLQSLSLPSPQWNHYRIVAQDGEVALSVNGVLVTRGLACNPKKGYICLESEGGVVHYRNVRIKELPETPIQASEIAQADRGFKAIYQGIDLNGWQHSDPTHWAAQDWVLAHRPSEIDHSQEVPADALSTTAVWKDARFLLDLKRQPSSRQLVIQFRNVQLDMSKEWLTSALSPVGNWDRIEFSQVGSKTQVMVNGKVVFEQDLAVDADNRPLIDESNLRIQATGEWDLANLYVGQVDR